MGEILLKYYKYVADLKGLEGKILLAQKTKIPSPNAAIEPDSAKNIELFKQSVTEIIGKPAPTFT
ncbi:MAG: hypothetical protein V1859_03785 [archaeon]